MSSKPLGLLDFHYIFTNLVYGKFTENVHTSADPQSKLIGGHLNSSVFLYKADVDRYCRVEYITKHVIICPFWHFHLSGQSSQWCEAYVTQPIYAISHALFDLFRYWLVSKGVIDTRLQKLEGFLIIYLHTSFL